MKPLARTFLFTSLALAGIGLVIWWSLRPSHGGAVFSLGDAETTVIDRIPEASLLEHEFSIVNNGMEYRIYKCVYAKSGDSHPVMLMFENGRLKNVFPWPSWERAKGWMERENVQYDKFEYEWGPPLDYARMLLELGGNRESDKWKVGFYSQGELDSVDWGLTIVALPFAVIDRIVSPRRLSSQTALLCVVDRSERLSRLIRLGMTRLEVESTSGCACSIEWNGLSYYVSEWDEYGAQAGVIIRYDANAKVDAVFNLHFGSKMILKREKWSKRWKCAGEQQGLIPVME